MSSDLNQCSFIGRLGRDAEYTTAASGVAKFSLAVNEEYLDKNTAEKIKKTEWINCIAFGKLADVCVKFLKKGARAYISGKFKTNKYIGKDGIEKTAFQIHVQDLQILTFVEGTEPHHSEEKQDTSEFDTDIPF